MYSIDMFNSFDEIERFYLLLAMVYICFTIIV
jgi:hypothetical protein